MHTFPTASIPPTQLDSLDDYAREEAGPQLREVLLSFSRRVREGDDVVSFSPTETVTPNQAAEKLGMSRTHLYKLLDHGEIPSHRVGRDRRILVHDLVKFQSQRHRDRLELAERFARQRDTEAAADGEIADLL